MTGCWLSLGENGLQRERSTQKPPCDWFGCHVCVEDNNMSANIHTEPSGRERQTGNPFKVKVVPYYWKRHISKGATFTVEVSGLCCTFLFALPLGLLVECLQEEKSHHSWSDSLPNQPRRGFLWAHLPTSQLVKTQFSVAAGGCQPVSRPVHLWTLDNECYSVSLEDAFSSV